VRHFPLTPASHHGWRWVPMTASLAGVIDVWVTEAGCTESHSDLMSAPWTTGENSYAEVPWSRSWLKEESLAPSVRKVSKGQDAMTSRDPTRSMFPRAETLVFWPTPFSSSLKRAKFSLLPVCNEHVVSGWVPTLLYFSSLQE